jgi:pimeloyl-ACP methyl ester carboxylesterase
VTAPVAASVEERWIELPEGKMRYLKTGSGRALILVHGLMGYSFSWRFTMPALAPYATVYAIDNLGAGLSTANERIECTVRATAKRVLQFADALGIREFDLLGTSYGGAVAMMVAAICAEGFVTNDGKNNSKNINKTVIKNDSKTVIKNDSRKNDSRLRRLALVAPVNPWSRHGKRLAPFLGSAVGSLVVRHTIERWRSLDHFWLSRMFGDEVKIPSDSLKGYRLPVYKNQVFRHVQRILESWTADLRELEATLGKIGDYPTLLIWGTKDRAVDFGSAERLRQNFRSARLVALEGVGHLPYEEAAEEFNRALIDFLTASF